MRIPQNFWTYLLCLLLMPAIHGTAQKAFTDRNVNYHYDIQQHMHLDHTTYFREDSATVFIRINLLNDISLEDEFDLYFRFYEDYQAEEPVRSVPSEIESITIQKKGLKQWLKFETMIPKDVDLLVMALESANGEEDQSYYYDITLDDRTNYSSDGLLLARDADQLPYLQQFLLTSDSISINALDQSQDSLWVYFYRDTFDIASPPMVVDNPNTSRMLTVDSLYYIYPDRSLSLNEPGLYFIQKDTNTLKGISFRVEAPPFPKYGTFEHLIEPTIYVATKGERQEVTETRPLRSAFQNFWLQITESKPSAQKVIKHYYRRVTAANYFFTSYKEGWKTDMGMIYIVFGQPDHVFKKENYEEWVYTRDVTLPTLRFTFVKIKNVFSDHHYSLIREKKYDERWFRAVEQWRNGEIN